MARSLHCGFGDLDAFLVSARVKDACDGEAGFGCRRGDQFDDGHAALEWAAAPVLRDAAEQPVFDLVPLRGAGRIIMDAQRQVVSRP